MPNYADLADADLADTHNTVVGLLVTVQPLVAAGCLPLNDWGMVIDDLIWLQSRLDAELEARGLLAPPEPAS